MEIPFRAGPISFLVELALGADDDRPSSNYGLGMTNPDRLICDAIDGIFWQFTLNSSLG